MMMRNKTKRKRMGSIEERGRNKQKWDYWQVRKSNQIQVRKMMGIHFKILNYTRYKIQEYFFKKGKNWKVSEKMV